MGHVFDDMFSFISVLFMLTKFYLGQHSHKYGLQNGSFTYDIGVLYLGNVKYTSLELTNFHFLHFPLFSIFNI